LRFALLIESNRIIGTHSGALATGVAVRVNKTQLSLKVNRFRVSAPPAMKRASLQKYQSPDSRAIMNREPLNIKDHGFAFLIVLFLV
jgi:hypothetical protein